MLFHFDYITDYGLFQVKSNSGFHKLGSTLAAGFINIIFKAFIADIHFTKIDFVITVQSH